MGIAINKSRIDIAHKDAAFDKFQILMYRH